MDRLRQTTLNNYEKCAYMCFKEWGDVGEPNHLQEPDEYHGKYAFFGTMFHSIMEEHANSKMEGVTVPIEYLHEYLDIRINAMKPEDHKDISGKEELETWRASLHEQIDWAYHASQMEHRWVVDVEWTFDDLYLEGIDLPFTGTVDRIVGSMKDEDIHLEDWKTGKTYTRKDLASNIQATVYALAFKNEFGFYPKTFTFYFSKHKKQKVIQITPEFLRLGLARIHAIWYGMKNNDFKPNCASKYFCKNFCKHIKECPKMKKQHLDGWGM